MKSDRFNKKDLNAHLKESAKKLGFMIWRPYLLILNSTVINAGTFYFGILITKGALEKLNKEEQFAILDHELGHIKRWKEDIFFLFYVASPFIPFIVCFIWVLLCRQVYLKAWLIIAILFLFLFLILRFSKLDSIISLKRISEFGADRISAELGSAKALISALQKKKADNEQSYLRILDCIYFSNRPIYPSTSERIKKLEEFLRGKSI